MVDSCLVIAYIVVANVAINQVVYFVRRVCVVSTDIAVHCRGRCQTQGCVNEKIRTPELKSDELFLDLFDEADLDEPIGIDV